MEPTTRQELVGGDWAVTGARQASRAVIRTRSTKFSVDACSSDLSRRGIVPDSDRAMLRNAPVSGPRGIGRVARG